MFLETDRLVLRPLTEADADDLFHLDNDPDVMRFINGGKATSHEEFRRESLPRLLHFYESLGRHGFWAAVGKPDGDFLGWFELRPLKDDDPGEVELGYRLRKAAWGRGYATEGARALIRKGFTELGALRVVSSTMTVNTASRRVMEKAGLTHVRTFHQWWPDIIEGSEEGDVDYALDKAGWERGRSAEE
ncbi:GNAT family N-acetyltransferase [Sphaerisporangium flaviroseum]|uniref:GNAT family N-acetyltransferase n=1 Tax=Sphaerisporangium flaviroseum TaxID=509199 RepID=A0ABP7IJ04_9ACTN